MVADFSRERMSGHTHVDWSQRYRDADTPWDKGATHPELARRLALGELAPPRRGARALVPGCGRGHDALALARAGWCVTAIDLAPEVRSGLARKLAALGGEFVTGDAFAWRTRRRFALVYEHTFFCAIDPLLRPEWGKLVRRVLARGGRVCAIAFPTNKPRAQGGPPHRMDASALRAALGPGFRIAANTPARARTPGREWMERWVELRR